MQYPCSMPHHSLQCSTGICLITHCNAVTVLSLIAIQSQPHHYFQCSLTTHCNAVTVSPLLAIQSLPHHSLPWSNCINTHCNAVTDLARIAKLSLPHHSLHCSYVALPLIEILSRCLNSHVASSSYLIIQDNAVTLFPHFWQCIYTISSLITNRHVASSLWQHSHVVSSLMATHSRCLITHDNTVTLFQHSWQYDYIAELLYLVSGIFPLSLRESWVYFYIQSLANVKSFMSRDFPSHLTLFFSRKHFVFRALWKEKGEWEEGRIYSSIYCILYICENIQCSKSVFRSRSRIILV
jgi:hypothetical protein